MALVILPGFVATQVADVVGVMPLMSSVLSQGAG